MANVYVDTDVLIRFLTGDDPAKQKRAAKLFEQVEKGTSKLAAPDTVIADAVYVLSSRRLYNLPHWEVAALLTPLVRSPGFQVKNRRTVLAALSLYGRTNVDFGDVMIVASMNQSGSNIIYSFDTDFDKRSAVSRQEPGT